MSHEMRQVADFPNYCVTSDGRVYSTRYGQFLKPRPHRQGYLQVALYVAGRAAHRQRMIHRLVAKAFLPNPDFLPEVNHKDGNKANNCVGNLEWTTRAGNQAHATATGLWRPVYGEAHGMAKLTDERVRYIKRMRGLKTSRELGDECGVSASTVQLVWKGRVWAQVQP